MQNEDEFVKRLQQRRLSSKQVDFCLGAEREFEEYGIQGASATYGRATPEISYM